MSFGFVSPISMGIPAVHSCNPAVAIFPYLDIITQSYFRVIELEEKRQITKRVTTYYDQILAPPLVVVIRNVVRHITLQTS
ncbi:hypothetical protein MAR_019065 [Mya arenaria]|uniref:Uncharacterized protein n=1 Tax=Mya arenaria TaxID=6604 RepID=A0ABY7EJL8_MYAAR|nr:hypothetical protein MAR_019065 [Mya arenaria]